MTREEKYERVYDYLRKMADTGMKRGEAIEATQRKFSILHPQTIYNIEKRVKERKEVANGK